MLNWDDLKFFVELARRGSLSETARQLKTDHSTVARRIATLEEALGLKLFDRMPRGYVLTREGQQLANRATGVEEAIFGVTRLAAGERSDISGQVKISAPPALASLWLAPRLGKLREAHPALLLDLVGETGTANLSRREADIAMRLSRPAGDALVARKLGALEYGLYGSQNYIDTIGESDWAFLGYDDELSDVPQQRWLKTFAGSRHFAMVSNDLVSLVSATRAGMGMAVIPHVIATEVSGMTCVLDAPEASRDIWLTLHPDLRRSARIRVTLEYLTEIAKAGLRSRPQGLPQGNPRAQ